LIYTNTQGSNAVDFSYTLSLNARKGTVSFQRQPEQKQYRPAAL
jgi:hemolysin activation/secretion protein